jgi:hypothetical protein
MWRKEFRRKTKHEKLRNFAEGRFKCSMQRQINNNKISKDNISNRLNIKQ